MTTHYFTLIVEGGDVLELSTMKTLINRCDDLVLGYRNGEQFADFDRQAESMQAAIESATRDIESVPGLTVVRVDQD